jgi:hypothetical protein
LLCGTYPDARMRRVGDIINSATAPARRDLRRPIDPVSPTAPIMLSKDFALHFANEWIAAWNAHDLERILLHYTDDFEMSSPVIAQLAGEPSGTLCGKPAVRAYRAKALAQHPDLHFDLMAVFTGAGSVTLTYRGHRGMGAEVFWFDAGLKVSRAAAHYAT